MRNLLTGSGEQTESGVPEDADQPDEDAFWDQVATNLRATNLRLLFVADAIPIELARIVEFLNAQFRDNIEVLAVEVKQFKGSAEERSTLVPNVIGHTAAPGGKGSAGSRVRSKISLEAFMDQLPSKAADATQRLLNVAETSDAKVEFGDKGITIRVKLPDDEYPHLVTVAWLYPPDVMGWKGLKNYAFGEVVSKYGGLPEKREAALDAWVSQFDGDAFGKRHHRYDTLPARIITHEEAAMHIDALAERLAKVIGDLQA